MSEPQRIEGQEVSKQVLTQTHMCELEKEVEQ